MLLADARGGRVLNERRQHLLSDGTRSRGYVPVEVELLDAPVSLAAKAFLLCVRREIDQLETDGRLEMRRVRAVATLQGVRERQVAGLLAELEQAGLVEVAEDRLHDRNFLTWSRTRAEREEQRDGWSERQQRSRRESRRDESPNAEMSPRESRVSHGDVTRDVTPPPHTPPVSTSASESEEKSPSEPSPPLPPSGGSVTALTGRFGQEYEAFVAELRGATGRRYRGDAASRKLYAARRREGRSADELLAAARGVAMSRHHMGLNDSSIPYNAPSNVLRSKVLDQLIAFGTGEVGLMRPATADEERREQMRRWAETVDGGPTAVHA